MPDGIIPTLPILSFKDNDGNPAVGWQLYTMIAGTANLTDTWKDITLITLNTQPIILDARGECTIWLEQNTRYKFVLQDTTGAVVWTVDEVSGAFPSAGLAGIPQAITEPYGHYGALFNSSGYVIWSDSSTGHRNKIINPNFKINQRCVQGIVTSTVWSNFTHDKWEAGVNPGGIRDVHYTFQEANGIVTITITQGTLMQVIEAANVPVGNNNVTLSWVGTAMGRIGNGPYGYSPVTGQIAGGYESSVEFGLGTVSLVQLEVGTIKTPFEQRTFQEELFLCQRYYEKSYDYGVAPGSIAWEGSASFRCGKDGDLTLFPYVRFMVPKKATYGMRVRWFNPVTGAGNNVRDVSSVRNIDLNPIGTAYAPMSTNSPGGMYLTIPAVNAGDVFSAHWTAECP
jgi:hypothetical protein